ncbi:MAG: hypothetical protein JO072_13910 [Parafilimonas sp.]|nr:hypothetical protein [Parafilimonas sp.]
MASTSSKLKSLQLFLYIFGSISILLFGSLFLLTSIDAPVMQNGGALRFLRWDVFSKHVELMIEIVYLVWGIFMLLAARKPLAYLSFLHFTLWANLAHGLLMIPQAFMVGMKYKMFTDVAYCLVLAMGLFMLLPKGEESTLIKNKIV